MTGIRVLLILSGIFVSAQSFPGSPRGYGKESTSNLEKKDLILLHTQGPQTMLESQNNSETGSSTIEFVFKGSNESVQNGSVRDMYNVSNLQTKNEAKKLELQDSSKDNKIDILGKDELYKLNITDTSKNGDLYEIQIKRDQWLFDPQETSSILGRLPKYFYDAAKPVHPFPESSEIIMKSGSTASDTKNNNLQTPIIEKSFRPPQRSGPVLYPRSVFSDEIDNPFYLF